MKKNGMRAIGTKVMDQEEMRKKGYSELYIESYGQAGYYQDLEIKRNDK